MTHTSGPDLATSIRTALADAATLPTGYRMRRLVLTATMPRSPQLESTSPVQRLLTARGALVLGSSGTFESGALVYTAADTDTWEDAAAWFDRHPAKQPVVDLTVATARFRTDVGPGTIDGSWTATLHPDVDSDTGRVAAGQPQLDAFTAATEALGGTVTRRPMQSGSLTYLALTLPDNTAAERLARFNALRTLEPAASISFR